MGLIQCGECGASVSSKAYTCPQCGAPIRGLPKKTVKVKRAGCGCGSFIFIVIIIYVMIKLFSSCDQLSKLSEPDKPSTPSSNQTRQPKPPKIKVKASLSNFKVHREEVNNFVLKEYRFNLEVKSLEDKKVTVYAVIYAKNDNFSPPRRTAWPLPGFLFGQAGTSRGRLRPSDITKNWNSKEENRKGWKVILGAQETKKIECALPLNDTSVHSAWRGKPLDPRSVYNEFSLWIFSKEGQLVFKQRWVKPNI